MEEVLVPEWNRNFRDARPFREWNHGRYHHLDIHKVDDSSSGHNLWIGVTDADPTTLKAKLEIGCTYSQSIR